MESVVSHHWHRTFYKNGERDLSISGYPKKQAIFLSSAPPFSKYIFQKFSDGSFLRLRNKYLHILDSISATYFCAQ